MYNEISVMYFLHNISYNMETLNQLFFSLARITSESQKLAYPEGKQVSLRIRRSRSHSEICIMGSTCYVCPEDTLSKDGLNLRGHALSKQLLPPTSGCPKKQCLLLPWLPFPAAPDHEPRKLWATVPALGEKPMVKRSTETGLSHVMSRTTCHFVGHPNYQMTTNIFVNMGHLPPPIIFRGEETCLKASP